MKGYWEEGNENYFKTVINEDIFKITYDCNTRNFTILQVRTEEKLILVLQKFDKPLCLIVGGDRIKSSIKIRI